MVYLVMLHLHITVALVKSRRDKKDGYNTMNVKRTTTLTREVRQYRASCLSRIHKLSTQLSNPLPVIVFSKYMKMFVVPSS